MANNKNNEPELWKLVYPVDDDCIMLDVDIAKLFNCRVEEMIEKIKSNIFLFPENFVFRLDEEAVDLLKEEWEVKGIGKKTLPYAFTEEGVVMLMSLMGVRMDAWKMLELLQAFKEARAIYISGDDFLSLGLIGGINALNEKQEEMMEELAEIKEMLGRK